MTRQTPDGMEYAGDDYVILYGPAQFGFDVRSYKLYPFGRDTGTHRGYWCEYAVIDGRLTLNELYVNSVGDCYPRINGVEAEAPRREMRKVPCFTYESVEEKLEECLTNFGYHVYRNIGLVLDYSGVVTIGRDSVALPFHNIGYPEPWTFGTVLELEFEGGVLKSVSDISDSFVEEREEEERTRRNFFGRD